MMKRITLPSQTLWGRWCLPSFNAHCDQLLKAHLADMDNNLCDGKALPNKTTFNKLKERKYINPWENPSAVVFVNMYGM